MKIVFAAVPAPGHLNPLLAVARLTRARGDEVAVVTGRALEPTVEAAGLRFVPLSPEGDFDYRALDAAPERDARPPGPEHVRRAFERVFVDTMPAQADTLRRAVADENPDLVVVDSLFLGALPLLLGHEPRPPVVACGVTILTLDRADRAPMGLGLPPARDAAERGRYRAIRAEVEAAFTAPVQAHADAVLAGMGLPPLGAPLMHVCTLACDAYLAGTVPEFEFDVGPLPAHVSFVGALPPPPAPPALGGLPDWWGELDGGRPAVLVTQGTVANADFGRLIAPTLAGLAGRDDLLVLATTGGRPVDALGVALPANARVAPFLPFAPLLPKVRALVTNGGYGTVQLALQAGVPAVVAGLTEDKAEVAARVAASGAGIDLHADAPTPDELRASVDALLAEPSYADRARAFATSFAAHDTELEVLSVLDRAAAGRRPARGCPDIARRPLSRTLAAVAGAACLAATVAGAAPAGPGAPAVPGYVRVREGALVRDGQPWVPHGFYQIAFEVPPGVAARPTSKPFWKIAYDGYTPAEYARMRREGADSVRFQVAQPGMDPQNALYDPDYAARAIGAVRSARAAGLTVILSVTDEAQTGEAAPSPLPNDATRRIWTYLAPIYGYDPGVLYELYNEPSLQPTPQNWAAWAEAMEQTIRTVRRAGARNVVLADGLDQAQHLDGAPLLRDPLGQVAYAAHPYANGPPGETEAVWEQKFGRFARRAPTIVSEWFPGYFCDADTPASTVAFFRYITGLNVGLEIGIWDFSGPLFRTVNFDFPRTRPTSFLGPSGPLACGAPGYGPGRTVQAWYGTGAIPDAPR